MTHAPHAIRPSRVRDQARLSGGLSWGVRVVALLAAVLVSGGFFALAHLPALRLLLYLGAVLIAFATLASGIGLLRSSRRKQGLAGGHEP